MLFNSMEFILFFLPISLLVLYWLGLWGRTRMSMIWLIASSAFFYAWFSVKFLMMLCVLIIINFILGKLISYYRQPKRSGKYLLIFGIVLNLIVLGYFKYTNFLISNVNSLFGTSFLFYQIVLPVGISFFTFQKIGYLVDAYKGLVKEHNFLDFCLFVLFFPQLIAGPIVHHKDIIPQFHFDKAFYPKYENIASGSILFLIGLIKKVIIADNLAIATDSLFAAVNNGANLGFYNSWFGALSFTFQIYFDFSAYSDMALGLAYMCGLTLPINFNSPYRANNIIDFWRRWHMTLSAFLRDYVYISLGGNRFGKYVKYKNIAITMLIGGLWHGAAWTFVIWGGLHAVYLVINHAWIDICTRLKWIERSNVIWTIFSRLLTFLAVVIAWVFFRAENFHSAQRILSGMFGINAAVKTAIDGIHTYQHYFYLLLFIFVSFTPSSQKLIKLLSAEISSIKFMDKLLINRRDLSSGETAALGHINITYLLSVLIGILAGIFLISILIYQSMGSVELHKFIYFQF